MDYKWGVEVRSDKDWLMTEGLLEHLVFIRGVRPVHALGLVSLGQVVQGPSQSSKSGDETLLIPHQSQE